MKSASLLIAAALGAIGFASAADTPAPPPAPPAAPGASPSPGGRPAPGAGARESFGGLLKEVEEKGKVTKEEFLEHAKKRAEEAFSKLDKNKDGVIDKSEVAEIEGRMKGLRERMRERGKGATPRKRPGADAKPDSTKPDAAKPSA